MKHRQALLCMALLLGACGQKPPPDAPVAKPPLPLAELGYAAMQAGNYVEAHDIWRTRAAAGDAEGQYNLGWLFHNGYGQAINDQQAAYWWQQAAGQGHVDSHLALAKLYQLGGRNFKPDLSLALPHLAVAVAADDEEARILFRLLLAKGGKAVQQALPEIIRQSPAALGAERFVGADTVELLPAPDAPGKGKDHPPLLPPATQLVQLGRQGGWVEVGVVATGERGWLRQRQLAPMPQPSQPLP